MGLAGKELANSSQARKNDRDGRMEIVLGRDGATSNALDKKSAALVREDFLSLATSRRRFGVPTPWATLERARRGNDDSQAARESDVATSAIRFTSTPRTSEPSTMQVLR
jgi:hypothetical protein